MSKLPALVSRDRAHETGLTRPGSRDRAHESGLTERWPKEPTLHSFPIWLDKRNGRPASKVYVLPRKLTSLHFRMSAGVGRREYLFTNLSFRARETTTFVPLRSFWKTRGARKVHMKKLRRTSAQALSQPGPATGPTGHFFCAPLRRNHT